MTPLERARELGEKAVFTIEEASSYERQTNERQASTNATAGPDWWDPGTRRLIDRRTSLIVDPPDGRLPALTPEKFEKQREVVLNERRQNYENRPYGLAGIAIAVRKRDRKISG